MGADMEMPPKSLSIRRYASEDMHSVGLSSPRRSNRKCRSWPNYDSSDGWVASCASFMGPFDGPVMGGETLAQLATSCCLPSEVLLAWRMLIFLYMIGTCIYLGQRGSLTKYTLSAEVYVMEALVSVMLLIPCFLPRKGGGAGCFGGRELPRTVSGFGRRRSSSADEIGGLSCCSNFHQVLLTTTTILLQSAVAMAIFWDIVFWTRLSTPTDSAVDVALLHSYNIVPLVVELICGNTEFSLVYFFPSFFFLCTYLGNAAYFEAVPPPPGGNVPVSAPGWINQLFAASSTPRYDWAILMALYSITCLGVFFVQRLRRSCGNWIKHNQDANDERHRRSRSNEKCESAGTANDDDNPWAT